MDQVGNPNPLRPEEDDNSHHNTKKVEVNQYYGGSRNVSFISGPTIVESAKSHPEGRAKKRLSANIVPLLVDDTPRIDTLDRQMLYRLAARLLYLWQDFFIGPSNVVQHLNPACRAARSVPHLSLASLLISLNDCF